MLKQPEFVQVKIDKLNQNGNGVGNVSDERGRNLIVEIPFSTPNDELKISFRKYKKNYVGKIETIVNPSPERVEPKCIHFGTCGGCRWQNLPYQKQLELKENKVKDLFKELMNDQVEFRPILGCDIPWHYRNKMEFTFSSDSYEKKYLGLIMDSSRGKVFNLTECHLVNPWYAKVVNAIRQWWEESDLKAYHPNSNTGSLRVLTVREAFRSGDRLVMLTVSGNPDFALLNRHLQSFVTAVRETAEENEKGGKLSIFLRIQQALKGVSTNFYEMHLYGSDHIRETLYVKQSAFDEPNAYHFTVSPTAFFQPNTLKAEEIYSTVIELAKINQDSVVYDLYCGTGSFGLCISKYVRQVVGIELSPESVDDAKTNIRNNDVKNMTIISGAVRNVLPKITVEKIYPAPDVILVDPPRPGLDPDARKNIVELNAPKIVYISCNPLTQVNDIKEFINQGYELKVIQPIDQFPQTIHVENIVLLEKSLS